MQSVLIIAYFFPPEGNAGSYRPLRFVRQLNTMGWRTSVVAADPYRYERYDPELLQDVPKETEIIRVRGKDPWLALQAKRIQRTQELLSTSTVEVADKLRAAHRGSLRSRIRELVRTAEAVHYRPDFAKPWIRPATKAAVKLCRGNNAQVIWATAGPLSTWVVARRIADRLKVPYVLDLRDPHGLSYYESDIRRPAWAKRALTEQMHQLFKGARAVVFLFKSVADHYARAFPGAVDPRKVHIIPNGFDGDIEDTPPPRGNKITVLYTGTIATYRYDTLLRALSGLMQRAPAIARCFRFRFVGEDMTDLAKMSAQLGLSDVIETSGATSHAEITRLQKEASAFLVLGRPSTIKGHELVAGAKLFNYLKLRRPVLGIVPHDETRKVLNGLDASTVADVGSLPEIEALLMRVHGAWSAGALATLAPDRRRCQLYSAGHQTNALVRALTENPAQVSSDPGAIQIPLRLRETGTE